MAAAACCAPRQRKDRRSQSTFALGCLQAQLAKSGHGPDVYVASSLVHVYASGGDAASARAAFDAARHRNVVTWTPMIAGHAAAGEAREAVALFREAVKRSAV